MATGRTLVLGGANLDTVASAAAPLRRGDSAPGRVRGTPGGVARNVAENLARLGHTVGLVSAVGDDPAGRALLAATQQVGVDVSACAVLAGEATASYVSLHEPDGTLLGAVNDMQVLERLGPALLAQHTAALRAATVLVVDANLSDEALAWVFSPHASSPGTAPVFADAVSAAKSVRLRPWLERVHTLKLNRLEAAALCGLPTATHAEVEAAAAWLHARGVVHVVISVGAQGLYFSARGAPCKRSAPGAPRGSGEANARAAGERGWLPACTAPAAVPSPRTARASPVQAFNNNGAGDALMAGLVHAHLTSAPPRPASLADAARFASACAAITMTAPSANHPGLSPALVAQWLALQAAP